MALTFSAGSSANTWDEAINNGGAPFDAVIVGGGMFGGYCADKISRSSGARPLRVLVLEAGSFLVPTHVQNLPQAGLDVPGSDLSVGRQRRCAGSRVGSSLAQQRAVRRSGLLCRRQVARIGAAGARDFEADDLTSWPPSVAQYLTQNYPTLEQQTGVADSTDFIQGPLFNLLKTRFTTLAQGGVANVSSVEDLPLAVQGQSPASGLFAFDKYSSVTVLINAARQAAGQNDAQRRLFVVPNAHITRLDMVKGVVTGLHAA